MASSGLACHATAKTSTANTSDGGCGRLHGPPPNLDPQLSPAASKILTEGSARCVCRYIPLKRAGGGVRRVMN